VVLGTFMNVSLLAEFPSDSIRFPPDMDVLMSHNHLPPLNGKSFKISWIFYNNSQFSYQKIFYALQNTKQTTFISPHSILLKKQAINQNFKKKTFQFLLHIQLHQHLSLHHKSQKSPTANSKTSLYLHCEMKSYYIQIYFLSFL